MCGLCGFIDFNSETTLETLDKMVSTIIHRGPDDKGIEIYSSDNCTVGFGHARLSIIDLSVLGHQPMSYDRFTIVYNGEIYNYKEIRRELQGLGHTFISGSDTEVILHSYEQWGSECVHKFIGMFAFVIYDKKKHQIVVFRDRAGVKPFYYYWENGLFLFGSELKVFHQHIGFKKEINLEAVHLYFQYGYIPSPYSIFKNCHKLNSGHILTFDLTSGTMEIQKYWDIVDHYRKPQLGISYPDAINEVEKLLISACNYRMVADVPVGVFLSGGFDSTAVTAILQKDRTEKIKTFTIGFETGTNEAPYAKATARYLGTDHTEYYCSTADVENIIPELPLYFDEPFSDDSALPTILVSKLARKDVTVALSADAGDEIFGGYNNYRSLNRNIAMLKSIPGFLHAPLSAILSNMAKLPLRSHQLLKHQMVTLSAGLKIYNQDYISFIYDRMQSYPAHVMKSLLIGEPNNPYNNLLGRNLFKDDISVAMAMDYKNYLQNDILTKVDYATMSVSLEGREPLLDHRLVEFVARLPVQYKYDGITTKKILRDIVYKYVPKDMMDRPKTGFSMPINTWLKSDLRPFLDEMLSEEMIKRSGIFNVRQVMNIKKSFLQDSDGDQTIIWKILQFQQWYNLWMK